MFDASFMFYSARTTNSISLGCVGTVFGRVCIKIGPDQLSGPIVRLHSGIKNLAGSGSDSFGLWQHNACAGKLFVCVRRGLWRYDPGNR